jgi:DNA-binding NtrC family response regulator
MSNDNFVPSTIPEYTGDGCCLASSITPPDSHLAALSALTAAFSAKLPEPSPVSNHPDSAEFVVASQYMQKLVFTADMLSNSLPRHIPVTITGPSGSGKELIARRFRRMDKPFIALNMAALPEQLIASILFGHLKGSFTGAIDSTQGAFIAASDGVLFLDEIGDMPLALQPILLRVIQERIVSRVGEPSDRRVIQCRIVVATNQRLDNTELFRSDLYARLNMISLSLPSLASEERAADYLAIGGALGLTTTELDIIKTKHITQLINHNVRALQSFAYRKFYLGDAFI